MKKLLVICGPTATGKTKLALHLAGKFNGEVVSADSRQVYKGMDIGTGKDLSVNAKLQMPNDKLGMNNLLSSRNLDLGFYTVSGVRIWGYDLVEPKKGFSVGQYIKIARTVVENIWARQRFPILVGGTGLYIKGVIDGIPTAMVRPNLKLRRSLSQKTGEELFEILANCDPAKAASLNLSDKRNPRRLIRAIEIALNKSKIKDKKLKLETNSLFVGLTAPRELLFKNIEKRVGERVRKGIRKEIKRLLKEGVSWKHQSMSSLGYGQWREFFKEKASEEEALESWKKEEHQYTKRQLTWFKKDKRINWFDITREGWQKNVEKLVEKWYSSEDNNATQN